MWILLHHGFITLFSSSLCLCLTLLECTFAFLTAFFLVLSFSHISQILCKWEAHSISWAGSCLSPFLCNSGLAHLPIQYIVVVVVVIFCVHAPSGFWTHNITLHLHLWGGIIIELALPKHSDTFVFLFSGLHDMWCVCVFFVFWGKK